MILIEITSRNNINNNNILFTLSYNISKMVSSVFVATCNVFLNVRKRRNIIRINPSTMVVDVLSDFYTFSSPTFL